MIPANYWQSDSQDNITCTLCPHRCVIVPQGQGRCRVRVNRLGKLFAINWGQSVAVHVDPIEKKPLYHFYPGAAVLSLGPNSCNLTCNFCQNYTISQQTAPTTQVQPDNLVMLCLKNNIRLVAFTYTEPFTWYEFIVESAKVLDTEGIKTVLVSNGYINPEPLVAMLPHIAAFNIDLKGFSEEFYQKYCGGSLAPVKEAIKIIAQSNSHLEVTNLVILGANDSPPMQERLTDFIAGLSADIPLHYSRYYPRYKLNTAPTPFLTLTQLYQRAQKKLNYVYLGNVDEQSYSQTNCSNCGHTLITRQGYTVAKTGLKAGKCARCGQELAGEF